MKDSKLKKLISLLILTAFCVHCGNLPKGKQAAPLKENQSHGQWKELAAALKLPQELDRPSQYISLEHQDAYVGLVFESANRLNATAWAYKCAAIEKFERLPLRAHDGHKKEEIAADIYLLGYRLQKNFEGEPEEVLRHGLVTIPHKKGAYPLLAFAHGGDSGLKYDHLARELGTLQTTHIVIAPTFPGEKLHEVEFETAVGQSIPWINDVDDLLGMHDCLANLLHSENVKKLKKDRQHLIEPLELTMTSEIKTQLLAQLSSKVKFYKNNFKYYPQSVLVGASRGGLVASLALAKAGAALAKLTENSKAFSKLFTGTTVEPEVIAYYSQHLGRRYGGTPPAFRGIATIASPATVTIGEFRIILEQMVKGNLDKTSAMQLPGIGQLKHIFDAYRSGQQSVEEAKFEIILRDASFLAPLIIAALKDWSSLPTPGSFLFVHGKQDKVVPYHQTKAMFNIIQGLSENKGIKEKTFSPFGLNTYVRIFESQSETTDLSQDKSSFHFDKSFYASQSLLPHDFLTPAAYRSFFHIKPWKSPGILPDFPKEEFMMMKKDQIKRHFSKFQAHFEQQEHISDTHVEELFTLAPDYDDSSFYKEALSPASKLLVAYQMINGYMTPNELTKDKMSMVTRSHPKNGEAYKTFHDSSSPLETLTSWANLIAK